MNTAELPTPEMIRRFTVSIAPPANFKREKYEIPYRRRHGLSVGPRKIKHPELQGLPRKEYNKLMMQKYRAKLKQLTEWPGK